MVCACRELLVTGKRDHAEQAFGLAWNICAYIIHSLIYTGRSSSAKVQCNMDVPENLCIKDARPCKGSKFYDEFLTYTPWHCCFPNHSECSSQEGLKGCMKLLLKLVRVGSAALVR